MKSVTPQFQKKPDYYILDNNIKCEIHNKTEHYTRVVTDTIIPKDSLQNAAAALEVPTDIICFHITGLTNTGEEYTSITPAFTAFFEDFAKFI